MCAWGPCAASVRYSSRVRSRWRAGLTRATPPLRLRTRASVSVARRPRALPATPAGSRARPSADRAHLRRRPTASKEPRSAWRWAAEGASRKAAPEPPAPGTTAARRPELPPTPAAIAELILLTSVLLARFTAAATRLRALSQQKAASTRTTAAPATAAPHPWMQGSTPPRSMQTETDAWHFPPHEPPLSLSFP